MNSNPDSDNNFNKPAPLATPPQLHARHAPHPPNPARPVPGENHITTSTAAVDATIRRADSTRRRQRVLTALDNAITDGAELNVGEIARRAGSTARSSTATAACSN